MEDNNKDRAAFLIVQDTVTEDENDVKVLQKYKQKLTSKISQKKILSSRTAFLNGSNADPSYSPATNDGGNTNQDNNGRPSRITESRSGFGKLRKKKPQGICCVSPMRSKHRKNKSDSEDGGPVKKTVNSDTKFEQTVVTVKSSGMSQKYNTQPYSINVKTPNGPTSRGVGYSNDDKMYHNELQKTLPSNDHQPIPSIGAAIGVPYLGPQFPKDYGKSTLVLDLDETLVHSSFKRVNIAAFTILVDIEGIIHEIFVCKRPGVDEFLRKVALSYEVVVFTASLPQYAEPLMDRLDPNGCCAWRLFRESCTICDGVYVKDLGKLGRDLRKVLIIDNSPNAYKFHPQNAIPIQSWFDNQGDNELLDLVPILEELSKVDDIPLTIRRALDSDDELSNSNDSSNLMPTPYL